MGKNTSVSLGNHFENFVDHSISKGRFKNASEVIRAGLRLLEDEENRINFLKNALHEGMESSFATDFNPAEHLNSLKKKRSDGL